MGNCATSPSKSRVEISPLNLRKSKSTSTAKTPVATTPPSIKSSRSLRSTNLAATSAAETTVRPTTTVRLHGSPENILTKYIRYVLQYKNVTVRLVSSDSETETSLTIQIGSEIVTGKRETLLSYIEEKWPYPPLKMGKFNLEGSDDTTPISVRITWLQHRSLIWHVSRMSSWVDDLVVRGGRRSADPAAGTPVMELKKFVKSYSQLLELMLEHAQMEERVVFPLLEKLDEGICKSANEDHARDLPMMNGIKEDIKSIVVLDSSSLDFLELLSNLATRLNSLLDHCKKHFEEEENNLLPMIEVAETSREQQKKEFEQCFEVMKGTHSHLFNFFLEGLLPLEAIQYLDMIIKYSDKSSILPNKR